MTIRVDLNLGSIENMLLDKPLVQVLRSEMATIIEGASKDDASEIRFRIESLNDKHFTNLLLNWSALDHIRTAREYCIEFFSPDYKKQKKGKEGEVNYHTCSRTIRASTDFLKNLDDFMTTITTYNAGFNTV